jgi:nitrate reductase gamma subunit
MTALLYVFAWLALAIFVAGVAVRVKNYLQKPIHVRWELYPVPHDSHAAHGGSYLEELDWWDKPIKKSHLGTLKVMVPEILLLKAVWEHNRPLWWCTYPFHLGLYCIGAFVGLLIVSAVAVVFGADLSTGAGSPLVALMGLLGPLGFILTLAGCALLFHRRFTDPSLREYSSPAHFFNLALFGVLMLICISTWLFADPGFAKARAFTHSLFTFKALDMGSGLFNLQVIFGLLVMAYIPWTHMSHFFMKYFLYHDIRWGDDPNIARPDMDKKIGVVLNYPVSWAASHIDGQGKKTWAEVATHNPMAEPKKGE